MSIRIEMISPGVSRQHQYDDEGSRHGIPFIGDVKAGFPSPAEDILGETMDLNGYCVKHPAATFYARVSGTSMDEDLSEGDLLVIDRSLDARSGDVAVCFIEGEFTVKRIVLKESYAELVPTNKNYPVLRIEEGLEFRIWGIVTHVIKKLR